MQYVAWTALSLCALLLVGASWEAIAGAVNRRRYPPPGQLIDVGGRRLHLHFSGTGRHGPTVVILPGRFNPSLIWGQVHEGISALARVCTYDRAGYAWSDPDQGRRTSTRVAGDLHTLLRKAEIPGPYLLVGHSLGAMYARCFAQQYPDEVCGIILVDPYTEGEVRGQPPWMKTIQARTCRLLRIMAFFGLTRLAARFLKSMTSQLAGFSPKEQAQIASFCSSAGLWRAVDQEWSELEGLIADLGGPGSLGAKPLVILSAGRCELRAQSGFSRADVDNLWRLMKNAQADLTQLSSQGRLVGVPDAGHSIQLEKPEAVISAVRELLSAS